MILQIHCLEKVNDFVYVVEIKLTIAPCLPMDFIYYVTSTFWRYWGKVTLGNSLNGDIFNKLTKHGTKPEKKLNNWHLNSRKWGFLSVME